MLASDTCREKVNSLSPMTSPGSSNSITCCSPSGESRMVQAQPLCRTNSSPTLTRARQSSAAFFTAAGVCSKLANSRASDSFKST